MPRGRGRGGRGPRSTGRGPPPAARRPQLRLPPGDVRCQAAPRAVPVTRLAPGWPARQAAGAVATAPAVRGNRCRCAPPTECSAHRSRSFPPAGSWPAVVDRAALLDRLAGRREGWPPAVDWPEEDHREREAAHDVGGGQARRRRDRRGLGPLRPGAVPGGHGRGVRARGARPPDRRHARRPPPHRQDRAGPPEGGPRLLRPPGADGGRGRARGGGARGGGPP